MVSEINKSEILSKALSIKEKIFSKLTDEEKIKSDTIADKLSDGSINITSFKSEIFKTFNIKEDSETIDFFNLIMNYYDKMIASGISPLRAKVVVAVLLHSEAMFFTPILKFIMPSIFKYKYYDLKNSMKNVDEFVSTTHILKTLFFALLIDVASFLLCFRFLIQMKNAHNRSTNRNIISVVSFFIKIFPLSHIAGNVIAIIRLINYLIMK